MLQGILEFFFGKAEEDKLQKYIEKVVLKDVFQKVKGLEDSLNQSIAVQILNGFQSYHEVHELIYGQLRYDLGIKTEEALIITRKIPEIIIKKMKLEIIQSGDSVHLQLNMVDIDYSEILSLKEASFIQTYSANPGTPIHWLEWLLTKGDQIIIGDHHVKYTPGNTHSRSGGAIMIERGSFRIPPQFAGTPLNNFITRALQGIENSIYLDLTKIL